MERGREIVRTPLASAADLVATFRQAEWLRPLVECLPVGLLIVDASGRPLLATPQAEAALGRALASLEAQGPPMFAPDGQRRPPREWPPLRAAGGEVVRDHFVEVERADGTRGYLRMEARPLLANTGAVLGAFVVVADASQASAAERALRRSEGALRTIFNQVSDAIFIHAIDGSIITVNERMLSMYGVDCVEAVDMSIVRDFSGPENPFDRLPVLWERVVGGEDQHFAWKARRPHDGTVFDVDVFLTRIEYEGRAAILATVRDVTERRQAEAERERLLVEHARARRRAEALGELAAALNATRDQPAICEAALGRAVHALGADHGWLLLREAGSGLRCARSVGGLSLDGGGAQGALLRLLSEGRALRLAAADGEHAEWLREAGVHAAVVAPLPMEGRPAAGLLVIGTLRSGRIFDDDDLDFAQAVAGQCAIACDRVATYEEARREAALRERFMAILGHDLRGPLSAVLLSAQALRRGSTDAGATAGRIERSASRALLMIRELLDYSRIHGGGIPMSPARVDLVQLVRAAVEELQAAHPDATVSVQSDGPVQAVCDPERMQQVLANLLANAVRHGDETRPVTVKVGETDGRVRVSVHNHGAPIAAERLPHVFEPFVRAQLPGATRGDGLGLGLFIVREIVRAHLGSVEVRSEAATGTTFSVELPAAPAERASGL